MSLSVVEPKLYHRCSSWLQTNQHTRVELSWYRNYSCSYFCVLTGDRIEPVFFHSYTVIYLLLPYFLRNCNLPCPMVQHRMKTSNRHVLTDNHKVGRRVAATNHGEHVGVGKDPQFWILFIEVTRDPRCALTKR